MSQKAMSVDETLTKLDEVTTAMREQFPKNVSRIEQLIHHTTTAAMAVQHLFDEQVRADFDRTERIRKAENEE